MSAGEIPRNKRNKSEILPPKKFSAAEKQLKAMADEFVETMMSGLTGTGISFKRILFTVIHCQP
jgi:hypothetical protein